MVLFLDGQILIPERNQVLEIRASLGHHYLVYLILLLQNNDDIRSGHYSKEVFARFVFVASFSYASGLHSSDRPGTRYTAALIMVF